ncbi:GNAT family N-acetyltransferase [Kribbella sp. HUAS MG21]|uniref:GNAT family N-acetyltransferase n=1 Tax=Kribbella sp. HUAS MG21 TaxID=3160966 RepID=A0AAU7T9X2_9ACTN
MLHIRPAQPADAAAISGLLHELGYPQDGTTAARIQAWAEDPAGTAYVADADGNLLGVIAVYVCPFFERTGSWARIVALVVAAQARGQGIGRRLVSAAESFAATKGCSRMEVTSADHRLDAHEFYRRTGYRKQTSQRFLRDLVASDR